MYLHVITSGIRNRTCTWQENIDLVQDMIIIGGHLYLKCNFKQFQSCVPKLFVDFMVKLFIIATH